MKGVKPVAERGQGDLFLCRWAPGAGLGPVARRESAVFDEPQSPQVPADNAGQAGVGQGINLGAAGLGLVQLALVPGPCP